MLSALFVAILLAVCSESHASDADPANLPKQRAGAIGYPSRDPNLDALPGFVEPPAGYGEAPFYWWLGDPLTKERLAWQLEQFKGMGISGLQINYAHSDQGGNSWGLTYPSDPPLFSKEWWNLVKWWSGECKKQGIAISLSDYTLGIAGQGYWMDEILAQDPKMRGSNLEINIKQIKGGEIYIADLPENLIGAAAYKVMDAKIVPASGIDLRPFIIGRNLKWDAPAGDWQVAAAFSRVIQNSVDPINPKTGPMIIEKFFGRFEKNLPGEGGRGLNFFFSDELNFGIGGNLWSDRFASEFQKRKGYDIVPKLAAIFEDIGPETPKIRLDYRDVMVALSEEAYFEPVFRWHYDRGMIYGCDHGGRGTDVTEFGDYFRTQRWMTGPGCDQPQLSADIVKNKVASSIAHLYERPRTWLEGYHSSGWGASSAQITDATFKNFVMGQNLLSLHGLYYSTHGGFWEWAPPCNHFRMPYWALMKVWMKAIRRLSYLMSQGIHRCDVAIIYPVASVEAGMDGGAAVGTAFDTGRRLYEQGIDFDYMDHESLARAKVIGNELQVSGEVYKVLVIPAMKAVRDSTIKKALEFKRAGGIVIALGALPEASDRAGRDDPELNAIVKETFGESASIFDDLIKTIQTSIKRDFISTEPCYVNHRKIGKRDVYMVVGANKGSEYFFNAKGKVELWDPWTGNTTPIYQAKAIEHGTKIAMPLGPNEAQLIVFTPGEMLPDVSETNIDEVGGASETIALDGLWEFELKPTLDNRFGDFRLPITDQMIGAEARRFSYWREIRVAPGPNILNDPTTPLPVKTYELACQT
ncbi:MAG: glycosyl hydrolase [Armatimonadetes bacterium]|nr:glycosyl hydrolase [Armatimonadota bacterium]